MGSRHADAWRLEVEAFLDHVWDLMLARDPRLDLLGPAASAPRHLEERAANSVSSVWNMQQWSTLRSLRHGLAIERTQGPDVEHLDVYAPESLLASPLLPSAHPQCRIGWVPAPLLVSDRSHVFLAGPRGTKVGGTIWSTTDPGLVAGACDAFLRCHEAARPWQEVDHRPRLEGRTLRTAIEMGDGATDQEIAAVLGVGQRTAAAEVRKVIDWCGARSRGHAIAILVGGDR